MFIFQLVLIQVIIFGVVIFLLKKIMLGSTESAVNRLNESYEEMEKRKTELAEKIKKAEEEYEKRKVEADQVASKMRDEAEQETMAKRDQMLKKAREEAEKIIADTIKAEQNIRLDIRKEEQLKLTEYCGDLLSQVYKTSVKDKMDELFIEEFIADFMSMDTSHIPHNIKEVEVVTRGVMSGSSREKLKKAIKDKMSMDVMFNEKVDANVIGGIILRFGTLVIDGSLACKIKDGCTFMQEKVEKES
ncbi:MAG: F0F1 ATP synthase subunit delta [Candidatus Omnitrophica bacterium]|nr:F0F1 ATP synthase subunit delta [Candidatus Omnitrophota bacterium]MDD5488851.1 F0F1 ATP synthase subunit delta [Candidatus Omnitrophota bacterium]